MSGAPVSWTVARLLEWTTGHFSSKGIESARLEAEVLLSAALGVPTNVVVRTSTDAPYLNASLTVVEAWLPEVGR